MPDRKSHLDTLAVVLLVGCCFLWGLNQVAAKVAMVEVPPMLQATLRSVGGLVLTLLWMKWRRIPLFNQDGSLPGGLLAGTLFALEFACIFAGLQYTTASRMAVFIYLSPFIVALGMPFIARGERLSGTQTFGLVLAFAGVVVAFAEGFMKPAIGPQQWIGDALGVLAATLWAATTLTVRGTRLNHASPEKMLFYQLSVSSVVLAAITLWQGEHWPAQVSALTLGSLAFQIVIVVFASYLVWLWLIRHYPATLLSAFALLTPVFGLLAGGLLLNEPITPQLLTALAGVTLGMALVYRRTAPQPRMRATSDEVE